MSVGCTKDGRWYAVWREPGERKQHRRYFGRGAAAELAAQEFDFHKKRAKKFGVPEVRTADQSTFLEIAQKYLTQKPISPKSRDTIGYAINKHIIKVFGKTPCNRLSMQDLSNLDTLLIKRGLKLATRNRYRSYCRAICQWATDNDLIQSNPFARFRPDKKREGKAPPLITDDEVLKIWQTAPEHIRWIIICMLNLGVRPGPTELFKIKLADVDFERAGIWIDRPKTHSDRSLLYCTPEFMSQIKQRREQTYLVEYEGRPVKSVKRAWVNTLVRAGIYQERSRETTYTGQLKARAKDQPRRIRLYDLRHKFASNVLSSPGADIKSVSEALGHSTTNTTLSVYYHLIDDTRRRIIDGIKVPKFDD
jgi:integrase